MKFSNIESCTDKSAFALSLFECELIPKLKKKFESENSNERLCRLYNDNDFIEAEIDFVSGDKITVVCKYAVYNP